MSSRWTNWRVIILAAGLTVLILLVRDFNSRMTELRQLRVEKGRVSAQVTSLVATKVALETQVAYAKSDEAVRAWAYEEGKWVRPGDELVGIVDSPEEETQLEPRPQPTPVQVENWQLWFALFFDTPLQVEPSPDLTQP